MKVFISHSSKDKWAARRISEDIEKIGAQTFLDEKDIRTGQSIDDEIYKHLKISDDFLIIISPASLKSDWVLVELGGALALEKNIIPILLYVGANEIPKIISLKLAKDINEIKEYYEEIKSKLSGKKIKPKKALKPIDSSIKAGDLVRIISNDPGPLFREDGVNLTFDSQQMGRYLGNSASVIRNSEYIPDAYVLDIDEKWHWAKEWLIKIE